jgi:Domain of unknown function (DUF4279)
MWKNARAARHLESGVVDITPTSSQRVGDLAYPTSGRLIQLNGWFLGTEEVIDSKEVQDHLRWLLLLLVPRSEQLHQLQNAGCRMDISCYWLSAVGHGGPTLSPEIMGELSKMRLEIWFDCYYAGDD